MKNTTCAFCGKSLRRATPAQKCHPGKCQQLRRNFMMATYMVGYRKHKPRRAAQDIVKTGLFGRPLKPQPLPQAPPQQTEPEKERGSHE